MIMTRRWARAAMTVVLATGTLGLVGGGTASAAPSVGQEEISISCGPLELRVEITQDRLEQRRATARAAGKRVTKARTSLRQARSTAAQRQARARLQAARAQKMRSTKALTRARAANASAVSAFEECTYEFPGAPTPGEPGAPGEGSPLQPLCDAVPQLAPLCEAELPPSGGLPGFPELPGLPGMPELPGLPLP